MKFVLLVYLLINSPVDDVWELARSERYKEAIELAKQYLAENKEERDILLALAFSYRALDSLDQAIEIYRKILSVNPDDYDALLGLALTLSWKGDLEKSVEVYREILSKYPSDLEALMGLARVYGWASKLKEAMLYADSAVKLAPQNPEVYKLRGDIAVYRDNLRDALSYYLKASELDSTNPEYLLKAAEVCEWMEDSGNAVKYLRRVLNISPDDVRARKALERIKRSRRTKYSIDLTLSSEKDSVTPGRYNVVKLGFRKKLTKWLELALNTTLSYNSRGDSSRNYLFIAPGLTFRPWRSLFLSISSSFNTGDSEANGLWLGFGLRKPPVFLSILYSRELLEPVNRIRINHISADIRINWKFAEIKGNFDGGEIPADTNSRTVYDVTVLAEILRDPLVLKPFYSFGAMTYEKWSPYYYSPEELKRHSLGLSIYKSFGRFYIYSDFSASVKESSGSPGVRTGSFEIGYGDIFLSFSYFATTQNYRYLTFKMGSKRHLPF